MSKNVAVFVDVANIFYAAKAAGVDIDYVTLLKSAVAGRDFVRAYAYTGLDPENENQRNFHSFLARNGYKVVSKDIRKYGDGKVKANLDIELVVDMMKTARNLDVAIVVSGDGDFAPAIRAVQEMGVRVEVISFKGNTSSDLIEVADLAAACRRFLESHPALRADLDNTPFALPKVAADWQSAESTLRLSCNSLFLLLFSALIISLTFFSSVFAIFNKVSASAGTCLASCFILSFTCGASKSIVPRIKYFILYIPKKNANSS